MDLTQTYKSTITKEEINSLPYETFEGKIVIISNEIDLQKCIHALSFETIIGIDTETRPNFQKGSLPNPVALLQLATNEIAFLIRLNKIGMPQSLIQFLENESIKRVGLSLRDDLHALNRKSTIENNSSFVDLQKLVKNYGIEDQSLQKIYAIIFNKKISKRQRLTNWEAPELTLPQQQYAALDAWACLKIYQKLKS